jgi:hypothetical protein
MATDYPTSLDDFENPTADMSTAALSHAAQHTNANDAIEALQAKVGVSGSGVTSSLDYKLTNTNSSNPGHKHTLAQGAVDVTASATELNYVDGVTSNIQTQLDGKSATSHTHDSRYYTEAEVDALIDAVELGQTDWGDITGTLADQTDLQAVLDAKKAAPVITIAAYNTDNGAERADYVCASDNAHTTINTAIAALPATGGVIKFLEGIYPIRDSLVIPSYTLLQGCGRGGATKIFKVTGGYPALKFEGASSSEGDYTRGSGMENITVEGNAQSGALLHCYYAQTLFFSRCEFNGAADTAIDLLQCQDSYFHMVTANTNLTTSEAVLRIRGGAGGSSNMLWFSQCRIEDFRYGAIEIEQGSGYSGNQNGFYFNQLKLETTQARGDLVRIDANALEIHFNQIFLAAGGFASGYSTPVWGITSAAKGNVSFKNIEMYSPTGVGAGVLNITAANGVVGIDNILHDAPDTATGVVNFNGSSGAKFHIGLIASGSGTPITGDASGISTVQAPTTFEQDVKVPDEAYGAGWNGSVEVPTKNALYDKIETLSGGSGAWGDITGTLSDQTDLQAALDAKQDELTGLTASVAELNILDGVTATAAELNALDGITASVTELNYTDGVTSSIQTQLNAKGDMNDLVDDTSPQLGGNLDLNQFNLELKPAPTSDHSASGSIATLTAAESLVFGDFCYMNASGKMAKADADAIATSSCIGLAIATISADATGNFLMVGFARDDTWNWTVGGLIYLSTTAGAATQTAPSGTDDVVQVLGVATHADRMWFNPNLTQVEVV